MGVIIGEIRMEDRFDVVIVGCGFSGLLCGHYLHEAGIETSAF